MQIIFHLSMESFTAWCFLFSFFSCFFFCLGKRESFHSQTWLNTLFKTHLREIKDQGTCYFRYAYLYSSISLVISFDLYTRLKYQLRVKVIDIDWRSKLHPQNFIIVENIVFQKQITYVSVAKLWTVFLRSVFGIFF